MQDIHDDNQFEKRRMDMNKSTNGNRAILPQCELMNGSDSLARIKEVVSKCLEDNGKHLDAAEFEIRFHLLYVEMYKLCMEYVEITY